MVECIYKHGGKVLTKVSVNQLLVNGEGPNASIAGVEVSAEGKTSRIMCSEVISTIGILNSYNLLGE
jgi:phytoene dehydrogenase-like protein